MWPSCWYTSWKNVGHGSCRLIVARTHVTDTSCGVVTFPRCPPLMTRRHVGVEVERGTTSPPLLQVSMNVSDFFIFYFSLFSFPIYFCFEIRPWTLRLFIMFPLRASNSSQAIFNNLWVYFQRRTLNNLFNGWKAILLSPKWFTEESNSETSLCLKRYILLLLKRFNV